jgi:sarcosine oxidase
MTNRSVGGHDGVYDVIVAGVGAMGAAALWHLARRGVRVLGLEPHGVPHALGSSHGYSRAIRLAYFEHPDYVPLLRRAWDLWGELEEVAGRRLLYRTGCLYAGPPDSDLIRGSLASAQAHGLPHEALDRGGLAMRFPQLGVPDDYVAMFEPLGGALRPEACVTAFALGALQAGARIHGHEGVRSWQAGPDGVTVETERGRRFQARHLLLCGGAWSDRLVTDLGVPLTVTRQVLGWVWPERPGPLSLEGGLPTWAIEHDGGAYTYGFPMLPDNPGFKLARHAPIGPPVTPETVQRQPLPGDEETFLPAARRFFTDVGDDPTVLAIRICLYTNSPDGHFIVDRHPIHENVSVACGFSGHGFKFAPVIGEALADMAMDGKTRLPIGFLGLGRFRGV